MEFQLTDEQRMTREMMRDFAENEIRPGAQERDHTGSFPWDLIRRMGALGLLGLPVPEEYGGEEMDEGWQAAVIVTEEIARASSSIRVQVNMELIGCAYTIYSYGSEELKQKYVAKLCSWPS